MTNHGFLVFQGSLKSPVTMTSRVNNRREHAQHALYHDSQTLYSIQQQNTHMTVVLYHSMQSESLPYVTLFVYKSKTRHQDVGRLDFASSVPKLLFVLFYYLLISALLPYFFFGMCFCEIRLMW